MLGNEAKSLAALQPIFDHEHEPKKQKSSQFSVLGPSFVKLQQYVMRYSNLDDEKTSPSHCLIRDLLVILANVKGAWTTVTLKYFVNQVRPRSSSDQCQQSVCSRTWNKKSPPPPPQF